MNFFESKMVKIFKEYILNNKINAVCYRLKQAKFVSQYCDIVIDSFDKDFYLAIECKSITMKKKKKKLEFYFSRYFRKNQIENFNEFINKSGRKGFLAIGYYRSISFIPWSFVYNQYILGFKSITDEKIYHFALPIDYFNNFSIFKEKTNIN